MQSVNSKNNSGFTLIELMVVMAIIGMLASIVSVSLSFARMKARDARRINNLAQIKTALELYYNDNGSYPPAFNGAALTWFKSNDSGWGTLQNHLKPYLTTLPQDPINTASCYPHSGNCYAYEYARSIPTNYDLVALLEDPMSPHRCGIKKYTFWADSRTWCTLGDGYADYSPQIYEASLN